MSSVSTSGSGAPKSSFSFGRIWDQYGMLVVFAVLFIACAIFVPNFATFINMKGLGLAISMSGMVACGMLFCLASGDFDLSVASVIACAGVTTAVVINLTVGRNTLAIGGNEEAARLAGVPVVRTKIIIFVLSGLVSAIAGIILASRMTSGQPMTSIGYELIVISACVLGGVSLKGGIGKISYVVAGILILGTVENAMNLLNISPFAQYVVRGLILLAAVIFDRYKQKAKRTV
ncbi:L-arabinose ABC transporter permease AraH [Escherichia coli]|nr:L-arabinose ABC transporter permease AraH [Escherichia coli]EFD1560565.1 L-arabinose ABC transporter permease AraH [Escherichia coli]HDX5607267.1 hypothetical protein [Escherichia coli]